jgi:hypothetical protein
MGSERQEVVLMSPVGPPDAQPAAVRRFFAACEERVNPTLVRLVLSVAALDIQP